MKIAGKTTVNCRVCGFTAVDKTQMFVFKCPRCKEETLTRKWPFKFCAFCGHRANV